MNYNTALIESQEELVDGKNRWKERKIMLGKVALIMSHIDMPKSIKLMRCADHLTFAITPQGDKTLLSADFCHLRICPLCTWRRSRKIGAQMAQVLARMPSGSRYLMLTLTIRNMSRDKLSDGITEILQGFKHLMQYKEVKTSVIGSYRALEVTYNHDSNTYHPHVHVLLAVKPSYFSTGYIRQSRWITLWQQAVRADYEPNVDIRTVKPRKRDDGSDDVYGAVLETCKYPTKVYDVLAIRDQQTQIEVLDTLDNCLFKRRLIAFGGLFRDIRRDLNMQDIETDTDLVHTGDEEPVDEDAIKITYVWRHGVYIPME